MDSNIQIFLKTSRRPGQHRWRLAIRSGELKVVEYDGVHWLQKLAYSKIGLLRQELFCHYMVNSIAK